MQTKIMSWKEFFVNLDLCVEFEVRVTLENHKAVFKLFLKQHKLHLQKQMQQKIIYIKNKNAG